MLREKRSRELEVEMEMEVVVEDEEPDMTVEGLRRNVQNTMGEGDGVCGVVKSECGEEVSGVGDDSMARRDLAGVVGRLLDIGPEGCFRLVVGFL